MLSSSRPKRRPGEQDRDATEELNRAVRMSDASDPSTANCASSLSESKHRAKGETQHFVAWLFSEPKDPTSRKDVIAWWELG